MQYDGNYNLQKQKTRVVTSHLDKVNVLMAPTLPPCCRVTRATAVFLELPGIPNVREKNHE